ncbi:MAG: DNA-methyltransferase [Bacteroidales bacterium]|jgi:site-specific DNA-methyltransferase (adenine-specific)|nr:MAG: Modification methylase DpnIIB [Bacteroidetes bacterium ADurb.Bin028]
MSNIKLQFGDCVELLKKIPARSVNQIFADPPYNLSGENFQTVKSGKMVTCDKGDWDIIDNIHKFNEEWIKECIRVLADDGTIWISGTLHNHPSIGVLLKKLNLWIINDVIWFKRNAAPLLSRNRLAPSTELIWVASKTKKYYFDYDTAKMINGGKQMRNLWEINAERHLTIHPTEKPETLLERIILLGSKQGDTILDPFTGSGTTGVVAKRLKRNFIGFELSPEYFEIAKNRINGTKVSNKVLYSEKLIKHDEQLKLFLEEKANYNLT